MNARRKQPTAATKPAAAPSASRAEPEAEPPVDLRRYILPALIGIALGVAVAVLVFKLAPSDEVLDRPGDAKQLGDPANGAGNGAGADETAAARQSVGPQVFDTPPPGEAPPGMVWIPGGIFWMGTEDPTSMVCGGNDPMPDARPVHLVRVDGFWMDATEVTNEQFARFVEATGYVTLAEREEPIIGSVVFAPPDGPVPLDNFHLWWQFLPRANWRHPEGPLSDLQGREKHPVVHVAYEDAEAYARWAGKQIPSEAQWEFAARGGLDRQPYVWGDELQPDGRWVANTFQGNFPYRNSTDDGFERAAPVGSFAPNGFGLFDMAGNVWEWCRDWYRPDTYSVNQRAGVPAVNPEGPADSYDPQEPGIPKRVQRGGSFLCTDQYCTRYMPGTRGKGAIDTGSNHLGFRCVRVPE